MSENEKPKVDANSPQFNQGVEAGLNSEADTQNWKAGNELGQELKNEGNTEKPSEKLLHREYAEPVFLKGTAEGHKGDAQDEKDEMAE